MARFFTIVLLLSISGIEDLAGSGILAGGCETISVDTGITLLSSFFCSFFFPLGCECELLP